MSSHAEGSPAGPHPDDGVLLDHLAQKLQGQALKRLLDHLAECDGCVDRLLDLDSLRPDPLRPEAAGTGGRTGAGSAIDFELEAAWRELRPRLGSADDAADNVANDEAAGSTDGPSKAGWWSRVQVLRSAAAILLVVSGLLTARVMQLTDRGQELERRLQTPQADVPVLYLESVRANGRPDVITAGDGVALLMVSPSDPRAFEAYGARLLDADQREIWRADGLTLSEHGSLRIALPRSLPPGTYTLALEGLLDGRAEPLETHLLELR